MLQNSEEQFFARFLLKTLLPDLSRMFLLFYHLFLQNSMMLFAQGSLAGSQMQQKWGIMLILRNATVGNRFRTLCPSAFALMFGCLRNALCL